MYQQDLLCQSSPRDFRHVAEQTQINFLYSEKWLHIQGSGVKKGGGEQGDGSGHPKSEITKIKIKQLDNFLIVRLLTHTTQSQR